MTLKAAVIGTGVISEEHLRFLGQSDQAQLVGVCDLSPAAARYAAGQFGAVQSYTDHQQMLTEASPQVVHILTPPESHPLLVEHCLDAGAHVFCEKPVALSAPIFESLWRRADLAGLRLIENHNYRFNQTILLIEKLVANGDLGQVVEVEVRMHLGIRGGGGRYDDPNLPHPSHQLPCGVIHEFISHLGYLMLRFSGGFDRVRASWHNHGGGDLFKYDDLDATVVFGEVHGHLRFSVSAAPDTFTVTVRGTRGYAQTDLFQPHLSVFQPRAGGDKFSPMANQVFNGLGLAGAGFRNLYGKIMQKSPYEGLETLLDRTYRALNTGGEPPISYQDMHQLSRFIDALTEEGNRF